MRTVIAVHSLLALLLLCPLARADVQTAGENHFSVVTSVSVKAAPQAAWEQLLKIHSWWSSSHTWSGDSKNLSLIAEPGGRFEEKLPEGGFVKHMDVVYSDPGRMLRMTGVLGPMQEYALQGTMTITLAEADGSTKISTTYHVSGHFPGRLDKIAPLVDSVLTEQFQRLNKAINDGMPLEN